MIHDFTTVLPGRGLGDLKFNMTRQEVEKIAGKPDEIENVRYDDLDDETVETWHYDKYDFSLSFEKEIDNKLASIAISSPEAVLFGQKLIGSTKEDVAILLDKMLVKDTIEDTGEEDVEEDVTCLISNTLEITFWFESDILTEIQWSVFDSQPDAS